MKILHTVESYLPSRHGMQEVVTQLSEYMVKSGHDVTIATSFNENRVSKLINGVNIVEFKISGNFTNGMVGEIKSYQQFLLDSDFDIITNFAAQQWATDLALPILPKLKAKKIFVPTGFSAINSSAYCDYFERMKNWMTNYDANIFLSNNYQDINFARENGIKTIEVIPNGANENEFNEASYVSIRKLLNLAADTKLILTVGSHTGYKGHSAAIKIFKKAKIPNSALLIIGNVTTSGSRFSNFAKGVLNLFGWRKTNCSIACKTSALTFNSNHSDRKIFVKECSREVTINAYKQADLFLFPSLIECSPIVLFESMCASTPFLVTDVGNAKEIIQWSEGGVLLPTSKDKKGFSIASVEKSAIVMRDLLNNSSKMTEYALQGNNSFRKEFTWSKIAQKYQSLYLKLVDEIK